MIVTTQQEAPEVKAELSDNLSWWSPTPAGPSLCFANALICYFTKCYSTIVKPPFVVSSGKGSVDAISKEHLEMLNVGEIGLCETSIPKV